MTPLQQVGQKIAEAWKAVYALIIPIAYGAVIDTVDVLDEWAANEGSVWALLIGALLTSAGVWLKANREKIVGVGDAGEIGVTQALVILILVLLIIFIAVRVL